LPDAASFLATTGSSNDPGTHATVVSSALPPWRRMVSNAPSSSLLVMKSLNRLTTMAIFSSPASSSPSIVLGIV